MTTIHSTPASEPKPGSAAQHTALPTVAPISPAQLAIIKATVPVLQAHGETIATVMYQNMITAHPAMNDIFSHTSQITGAQPRALARAVLAYALHIDNLPALGPAIERIAQKHASLSIQPAQYDVVGTYLIGAIGEVLGDAATPAIVDAWTAAYGVLASVFVAREVQLYRADAADGTWTAGEGGGWRAFCIAKKVPETADITSFYLEPADGVVPLPAFLPGQYVSLRVHVPQLGHLQSRQFSLSAWPGSSSDGRRRQQWRVSVKKEHDDAAGVDGMLSSLLHGSYREGDTVELSHPHGEFFLRQGEQERGGQHVSDAPVVLVSAGVGATPLVAMLQALVEQQQELGSAVARPVSWVHASRSRAAQPFADEVARIVAGAGGTVVSHVHLRQGVGEEEEEEQQLRPRFDVARLDQERELFVQDRRAEYYICGPERFMLDVRKGLVELGVDRNRVFLELFATGDVEEE